MSAYDAAVLIKLRSVADMTFSGRAIPGTTKRFSVLCTSLAGRFIICDSDLDLENETVQAESRSMELDLEHEFKDRAYQLLASLVTPRPIALVTTLSPDSQINAAPFSFFNVMGSEPPVVAFAPGDRDDGTPKDTARNIRLNHEFVVNLVDEAIAEQMNRCAATLPYGVNELEHAGLSTAPSRTIKPPRIAEAPASFECVEWGTLLIGENRIVIGVVKHLHVRDDLFDPVTKRIRSENLATVGRMAAPHWYCRTRDRFEMIRPA